MRKLHSVRQHVCCSLTLTNRWKNILQRWVISSHWASLVLCFHSHTYVLFHAAQLDQRRWWLFPFCAWREESGWGCSCHCVSHTDHRICTGIRQDCVNQETALCECGIFYWVFVNVYSTNIKVNVLWLWKYLLLLLSFPSSIMIHPCVIYAGELLKFEVHENYPVKLIPNYCFYMYSISLRLRLESSYFIPILKGRLRQSNSKGWEYWGGKFWPIWSLEKF